jgi:hypothetical protein
VHLSIHIIYTKLGIWGRFDIFQKLADAFIQALECHQRRDFLAGFEIEERGAVSVHELRVLDVVRFLETEGETRWGTVLVFSPPCPGPINPQVDLGRGG